MGIFPRHSRCGWYRFCMKLTGSSSRMSNAWRQMVSEIEKRRHQRQEVLLPLRVANGDLTGKVLYEGVTINVGAGGVYFRTYRWRDFQAGSPVEVVIDVPAEMNGLLGFGGMMGRGVVVRVEESGRFARLSADRKDDRPSERGVALRFESKLTFEAGLDLSTRKENTAGEPPQV